MLEVITQEGLEFKRINIKGRVDGMSSPDIHRGIDELVRLGERVLIVSLEEVNYISSAGLRVFLQLQKQLERVNGELLLYRVPESVSGVLKVSGLLRFFRLFSELEEIDSYLRPGAFSPSIRSMEKDGVSFQWMEMAAAERGGLKPIGSQRPLASAGYKEKDVVGVKGSELRFGAGLAALGEEYEDYRMRFGETVILDRNLFYYPAARHAAVDFMLSTEQDANLEYKFLHGFGFEGSYRHIASFESSAELVDLSRLVGLISESVESNLFGLVIIAESKGLRGMNLKRVPSVENKPDNDGEIFDDKNFAAWMNFPVDPSHFDHIIAGAGIAVKERDQAGPEILELFPEGSDFHIHAGVFSKGPLSKQPQQFEEELGRIVSELEVFKVQHILGQSCFSRGMVGVIELKG